MRCFLSHNKADKLVAESIGGHLALSGIEPWFDEWEIQAGDSIPGKLNEGLAAFDAFILVWSANAERSKWVRQEQDRRGDTYAGMRCTKCGWSGGGEV